MAVHQVHPSMVRALQATVHPVTEALAIAQAHHRTVLHSTVQVHLMALAMVLAQQAVTGQATMEPAVIAAVTTTETVMAVTPGTVQATV